MRKQTIRERSIEIRRRILHLNRLGKQSVEIARELNTTTENVVRHLRLAGAMMTPYGDECGFSESVQRKIVCENLLGISVGKLADKYKCADYRIMMVLWKYGVPERQVLEAVRRKQAVWMSQTGMNIYQIASCFGYASSVISRWFKEENFKPEPNHLLSKEQKSEAVRLHKKGFSYFAIGKKLKMAPNSVRNLVLSKSEG